MKKWMEEEKEGRKEEGKGRERGSVCGMEKGDKERRTRE